MLTCGDLEDKVHAKETLRKRIKQTKQCISTDNINIYSLDSSMLHFIVASDIEYILFLFSDIITLNYREESHCKVSRSLDRSWPFWTVVCNKIMSIMHEFCTSPTKLSSVVLSILVLFLYAISPGDDTPIFFMGYAFVHVVLIMALVMIYEICFTRRAREITRSISVNHLIGCDDVPSSEAFLTRRRLQELSLQFALLDRELYEFENLTLRELPSANIFGIPSMNEEEITALPVHNYKGSGLQREDAPPTQASSSSASAKEFWRIGIPDYDSSCDELTCNICLEEVLMGDLVRSLPCSHQFHMICIDPWLGLSASCPICKMTLGSAAQRIMK